MTRTILARITLAALAAAMATLEAAHADDALAFAAAAPPAATPPEPAIIRLLRDDGATVTPIGSGPDLAGYRVTRGAGDPGYTVYVTPSGHAVVGALYAPDGLLVTARQIAASQARSAPAPAAPTPPTTGFVLGSSGPPVHVFADPACPVSRTTVARLALAALQGELMLTVIPVALLGAGSAHLALAAVGRNAATAWFEEHTAPPTDRATAAVRANNAHHRATGLDVVPVVRTFDAGGWHDRAGGIDDVAAFLAGRDPGAGTSGIAP